MKMVHKECGGEIRESEIIPPYVSEEHGTVPAYECSKCSDEIQGEVQIEFIPENEADKLQIEAMSFV